MDIEELAKDLKHMAYFKFQSMTVQAPKTRAPARTTQKNKTALVKKKKEEPKEN